MKDFYTFCHVGVKKKKKNRKMINERVYFLTSQRVSETRQPSSMNFDNDETWIFFGFGL